MTRILAFLSLLLVTSFLGGCQTPQTRVHIRSTIHGAHKINPNYTYEDLYAYIDTLKPDVIGVEIRSEDMDSSVAYLDTNYPSEMFEMISKHPERQVVGFDWLGEELEGQAIPPNYWREISRIKKIERQLQNDSLMQQQLSAVDSLTNLKMELITQATLSGMNDGRYDQINREYYQIYEQLFEGTRYQALTDFYRARNRHIAENIKQIIHQHPGKKLLFLMGADHRSYVWDYLAQRNDHSMQLQ
jgi:hypothetical protein